MIQVYHKRDYLCQYNFRCNHFGNDGLYRKLNYPLIQLPNLYCIFVYIVDYCKNTSYNIYHIKQIETGWFYWHQTNRIFKFIKLKKEVEKSFLFRTDCSMDIQNRGVATSHRNRNCLSVLRIPTSTKSIELSVTFE